MHDRLMRYLLSRLDPRAAPIISRLAVPASRPSLNATLIIGGLIFVIGIAISIGYWVELSLAPPPQPISNSIVQTILLIVMVIASATLLLLPPVAAGFAAMLSARDVMSDSFSLLRLTSISGQAIFQGYVIAALYRLRVLLAVAFGALPMYAAALASISLIFINVVSASPSFILMGWDLVLRVCYYGLAGIGIWGMTFFAAVMGVNVGLRAQSPILAASIAPVGVIVMMGGVWLLLNGYVAPLFNTPVARLYPIAIPMILGAGLLVAVLPYLATRSALRQIHRPLPEARDSSQI